MAFDGFIWGILTPPISGAHIITDNNSEAISSPNGYFYMSHCSGNWTLAVCTSGYNCYTTPVVVQELGGTEINPVLTPSS